MIPQISIIVPVFNGAKYISRCLNSIVAQSFTDWECIIVDDGSTDKSGNICDEYASKDTRFHVIHKQNEGVSKARNLGIQKSKGDYIAFLDADDYLDNFFVEKMINMSDSSLVVCAYHEFGCRDIRKGPNKCEIIRIDKDLPVRWNKSYSPYWIYIWGKMFKSEIVKSNNLYFDTKMRYLEDFCFVLNYLCYIDKVHLIDKVLVYHLVESSKYTKYHMRFDEFKHHIQKQDVCFRLLEKKCDNKTFDLMKDRICNRHFYNFKNYIVNGNSSLRVKYAELKKYRAEENSFLFRYISKKGLKFKIYSMFLRLIGFAIYKND